MRRKTIACALSLAAELTMSATEFSGIGAVFLTPKDGQPHVIGTVFEGSPAERAGIKKGWFLISINGTNGVSWSLRKVLEMVRGPIGSSVTLNLADPERTRTNQFTVKREKIILPE